MKKLMIVVLIYISIMGCKDNEKKAASDMQPTMQENSLELKNDASNKLELGCYEYKTDGNEVKMEVTKIEGDAVSANLRYAYAEKDKNDGTFYGNLHGDKLFGTYTFMSEGKKSVRDVAFKIEKDQIVEGFGDLVESGTTFKNTSNLTYSSTTPWKKVDCEL